MSLEKGRTYWDLDYPFSIKIPSPCLRAVVRFKFAQCKHGMAKICLSYEGCEF